jgi:hypothetical protein
MVVDVSFSVSSPNLFVLDGGANKSHTGNLRFLKDISKIDREVRVAVEISYYCEMFPHLTGLSVVS